MSNQTPIEISQTNRMVKEKIITVNSWSGVVRIVLRFYQSGDVLIDWNPPVFLTNSAFKNLVKVVEDGVKDLRDEVKQELAKAKVEATT